ncbi:choice-of-anchor K domain-containing protein [uncultured Roseobacter sp.]|uniref:choice-of-anchor K domain-containing protein n=1 Tax=uncultured Roseobacter sp. TaxID=114847 RepID=UPI002639AFC5|nr:choice-of-anchor K domain-containing protein [uncultured Roseobacter sp.]
MFKKIAIAGALSLGVVGAAQASTISGSFSGTVDAPSGATDPSIQYIGAGTSKLEWGTPNHKDYTVESGNSSSLEINTTNFSFEKSDVKSGSVLLGTITWNNQSNFHTGSEWTSNVNLGLNFFAPLALALSESIAFEITNTPDVSFNTDTNEATGNNADEISGMQLAVGAFGVPLDLGGGHTLDAVFFDLFDAGKRSAYNSGNGFWTNVEGGTSTIGIYADISTVPLPAGMWLLLGGLGGLAAMRRQDKKAA